MTRPEASSNIVIGGHDRPGGLVFPATRGSAEGGLSGYDFTYGLRFL